MARRKKQLPLVCWICNDPIEVRTNSLPIVGHPELRVCVECDDATKRNSGKKIGDAIAAYAKAFDEQEDDQ